MSFCECVVLVRSAARALAICAIVAALPAQATISALRAWGSYALDSGGRDGRFIGVAAYIYGTAVLRDDGRIFVNGENSWGVATVPPLPVGRQYVDVSLSWVGAAAVLDDGSIAVWGAEYHSSYMPTGIVTFPPAPPRPPGVGYVNVAVGGYHVVALRSDGVVVAWGDNSEGQCNVPAFPPGVTPTGVRADAVTSYVLMDDGSIVAFGSPTAGGLAIPPLPAGVGYRDIRTLDHFMALRTDGEVVAWGDNSQGQCNVPPLPPGTVYTAIAGGDGHSHAARSDGVIVSWGGVLGLPLPPSETLLTLPLGVHCTGIACGADHMIALLSDGSLRTWGLEAFYQCTVPSLNEASARGALGGVSFIDFSSNLGGAAVTSTGKLVGWSVPPLPAAFAGKSFTRVKCGYWHHAAMTTDGEIVTWGSVGPHSVVPPLPPGVIYTDFEIGAGHTVFIRSDGQAVASPASVTIPSPPPGVRYVACEANELYRTVLLRSDGQILSVSQPAPVLPSGLRYVDIGASRTFVTAIRSDGSAVWWGSVSSSSPSWRGLPTLLFGVYFVEVDGGYDEVILRRSDGHVEVCGRVLLTYNATTPLDPGTSYVQVSAGADMAMARVGRTCTYVSFAHGCAGSRPAPRLVPRDTPKLGRSAPISVFDAPQSLALMIFGAQSLPTPVSLGFVGMPGCDLRVSVDAVFPISGSDEQAVWTLQVPDSPDVVGLHFYNQALVFDPAAGNGLGAVLSDAAEGVIGDP